MKTVLPQGTGSVDVGGVPLAIMIAIALVIVVCGALWAWDAYQSLNRPRQKPEPCEEDRRLDRLAEIVDHELGYGAQKQQPPAPPRARPIGHIQPSQPWPRR